MINLVELMADDEDCAFDQPCKYGNRVDGHAVYCHNDNSEYRKCRRSWYNGDYDKKSENSDYACKWFELNPNYVSQAIFNEEECNKCN